MQTVGVDTVAMSFCQVLAIVYPITCMYSNTIHFFAVEIPLLCLYRKGDPPLNVLDLSTCTIQTLGKLLCGQNEYMSNVLMCHYRGSCRGLQSFWVSLCHVDGVTVTGWLYHKEGDNRCSRYVCLATTPALWTEDRHYVFALLSVEQVRSMGQQTGSESRVVFLQHMRNTNSNTNVNTVNLRGFMDEVSVHLMYVCIWLLYLLVI